MDPKNTGAFIAELRKERGLNQKELADKLNVTDKAVSRWETGRGYPDVESLMALSEEFSVSVNEILGGKRIETPAAADEVQCDIARTYIATDKKRRRTVAIAFALAVVLGITVVLSAALAIFAIKTYNEAYDSIVGSPDCVIAADYSYMTLYGERYVPLVVEDAYCQLSDIIVLYATVEDSTLLDKLFFGTSVYSVAGCTNNEVIIVDKDSDSLYYCLESKYDEYLEISKDDPYDKVIAEIIKEDSVYYSVVSNEFAHTLKNYDFDHSAEIDIKLAMGDEKIAVSLCTENEIFRRNIGELVRFEDEYYFADNTALEGAVWVDGNPANINGYVIDASYDDELDKLFSYKDQ